MMKLIQDYADICTVYAVMIATTDDKENLERLRRERGAAAGVCLNAITELEDALAQTSDYVKHLRNTMTANGLHPDTDL